MGSSSRLLLHNNPGVRNLYSPMHLRWHDFLAWRLLSTLALREQPHYSILRRRYFAAKRDYLSSRCSALPQRYQHPRRAVNWGVSEVREFTKAASHTGSRSQRFWCLTYGPKMITSRLKFSCTTGLRPSVRLKINDYLQFSQARIGLTGAVNALTFYK